MFLLLSAYRKVDKIHTSQAGKQLKQGNETMTTRQEQIAKLYNIMLTIYTQRNDSHPEVAAQFHVDHFVAQNRRNEKWFDELLQMEIEDCSRALVTN